VDPKDSRSFKLAIIADYFVNPNRYVNLPLNTVVYDVLRDLGYGILKMPETNYPSEKTAEYLIPVMDQAEEYIKRGYQVIAVGLSEARDFGIHYSLISSESAKRGVPAPRLVLFSATENLADRTAVTQRIAVPL
jgi:signal recognition particle subunit SEC65